MWDIWEEDRIVLDDKKVDELELREEEYNIAVGASVLKEMSNVKMSKEGMKLNYAVCSGANAEKILRSARQLVFEHYVISQRQLNMMIYVGIGELATPHFEAAKLTAKIRVFLMQVAQFVETFSIRNPPRITFARLFYPIGTRHAPEIDKFNEDLELITAEQGLKAFNLADIFYRQPQDDKPGNVYVNGRSMFSPKVFWRNPGDNHPKAEKLPEVDSRMRNFFRHKFQNDFETEKQVLGICFNRKRRYEDDEENFVQASKSMADAVRQDNYSSLGARPKETRGEQFSVSTRHQQESPQRKRFASGYGDYRNERRENRDRRSTLSDWIPGNRPRRTRWSEEERTERFEAAIASLPEHVQDRRRRERETRLQEAERTRMERDREIEERKRQKEETQKLDTTVSRMHMYRQYQEAKKKGDADTAHKLMAKLTETDEHTDKDSKDGQDDEDSNKDRESTGQNSC